MHLFLMTWRLFGARQLTERSVRPSSLQMATENLRKEKKILFLVEIICQTASILSPVPPVVGPDHPDDVRVVGAPDLQPAALAGVGGAVGGGVAKDQLLVAQLQQLLGCQLGRLVS